MILGNQKLRKSLAHEDPMWFCLIYLRHYFRFPFAPFHLEMFHILNNPKYQFIAIMAFRESGKSTIMNTANILWSILGKPQNKFVIILSQSQEQAKSQFMNIKDELKFNELLREDFGPFTDYEAEWKNMSLELTYHDSKILSASREQSIRGMNRGGVRPDLVVCDDLEDISIKPESIESEELYQRFMSEIIPLGSSNTRIIVLGNLVDEKSFMMRLKEKIDRKEIDGIFRAYPLLDDNCKILWQEKYPDLDTIRVIKKRFDKDVWMREFLLKISGSGTPIFCKDWDPAISIRRDSGIDTPPEEWLQQFPLIKAMEEFEISAPLSYTPSLLCYDKDREYLKFFRNVYLGGEDPINHYEKSPCREEKKKQSE